MISLVEALNYRCLRYIKQPLGPFNILVGPNASGKTTFLDVLGFLGDLVSKGIDDAVVSRTQNFQDLIYGRRGGKFELAIEAAIPDERRKQLFKPELDTIRYEVAIGVNGDSEINILSEKCLIKKADKFIQMPRTFFPQLLDSQSLITPSGKRDIRTVINKVKGGNDNYYNEVEEKTSGRWSPSFKLGPRKSALANLPDDQSKYPAATWLKSLLSEGVQKLMLNSLVIRKASPPGQARYFKPDGSNLPWMIEQLRNKSKERFDAWIGHIQTALPDIEDIRIVEREDDKHKYLMIRYHGGLEVPSWMASDGTLRLLALTLPAYLPGFGGVYLVEEPENGIHPRAVETLYQSLSSIYDGQILLATHSPVMLSMADADKVLCFAKTAEGATDIVLGSDHPALKDWKKETNLGVLYAAGVLG
ncbi:MAG: ATP-binding protein [Elusimicrobiales bacterium]|nr:ATP-binding protein [Elusimicrobiales bacterium]